MAEQPSAAATKTEAEPPAKKSSLLGKLMVLGFVAVVVIVECVGAYLFLPQSVPTEAAPPAEPAAEKHAKPGEEKDKGKDKDKDKDNDKGELPPVDQVEVDLGQFSIMAFQPASNTTLRITVHMFGLVAQADAEVFGNRMEEIQNRFRDQVIVTLRGAEQADLTDAGLGLLKRTISEKTNAMLGKPLLKMIIFSDYSFVELR